VLPWSPNENKISDGWRGGARLRVEGGISWKVRNRGCQPFADGMGLGMNVVLDGRRGRSVRLASDGTGKQQNHKAEAQCRQGLERCSGVTPRLKAE
jgi:hypothetical protein